MKQKYNFKKNDLVEDQDYGKGYVESVNMKSTYPITVQFNSGGQCRFTKDGRGYKDHPITLKKIEK